VSASSQFWYSVFGEGRTYVDAYVMAVVLLLATPAGAGVVPGVVTRGAHRAHASLLDRVFATDRVITSKHLAGLAAVLVVALVLVARRRVLWE
jgi:hypothetical protein